MMKNLRFFTFYLLPFALYLLPFTLSAQDWRWTKSGGSLDQFPVNPDDEEVVDMATDPNGNVYVLSLVNEGSAKVAGMSMQSYGSSDMMVSSFKCDGSLRWAKMIGGPKSDFPKAIATDNNGGVYIAALISLTGGGTFVGNIDADATIPQGNKSLYLIKYDTSGNYQWYRAPQADSVSAGTGQYTGTIDMSVDAAGNIHWFCQLPKGIFGGTGGYVVNTLGDYMLKYDAAGSFQGGFQMDILLGGGTILNAKMVRNHKNGRYYISGHWTNIIGNVKIGTTTLTGSMYIACFENTGQSVWYRQNTDNNDWTPGFFGGPALDAVGNIYVTGGVYPAALGKQAVVFNGFTVQDNTSNSGRTIVVALDPDGNNIWATSAIEVTAGGGGLNIAVRNSGEVWAITTFTGNMKWPYYNTSYNLTGANYKILITRFNTQTGKILGMDTIVGNSNTYVYPSAIVADSRSNIFVGGYFEGIVTKGGNTVTKTGGSNDWFIAKYGYNCNCSPIPDPKFSFVRVDKQVNYTYTGTGQTSIEWDFGDGSTSTQTSPQHTYANNSFYQACVKVSNSCGDNIYCQNIFLWPVGMQELVTTNGEIRIYPNPATDQLTIEGAQAGMKLAILNIMGQQVYTCTLHSDMQQVNTSNLMSGNYILQLTTNNGSKNTVKMVKQ